MVINPKKLVEYISNSKYTKGVEICINFDNFNEKKYLSDLVFELKRSNYVLQIHGNVEMNLDKQLEYIKQLEEYSDYLGYPIVITFHTIYDENKNISLSKTLEYISEVICNINNEKIVVCLENLNDLNGTFRLNKGNIKSMILNDEKLYFTYDIGHEICNHGNITDLDEYLVEDIRNVHLHSYDNKGIDHMPIYKGDIHWNEIVKAILFLINKKYKYNIVFEYGLEYCYGVTTEEKLQDYLKSIDYVSERWNEIN